MPPCTAIRLQRSAKQGVPKLSKPNSFFVGIGAQKSGTKWLGRYFSDHPQIGMVPIKECHYWTSKYTRHQRNAMQSVQGLRRRLPKLIRHLATQPGQALPWLAAYGGMMAHRDASYRRFLELSGEGARIAGEITPSYATLPAEGFRAIESCLDKPKYILLLRNPADRFLSHIRHQAKYDRTTLHLDPLDDLLPRPDFALRSDYVMIFRTCQTIIDPARFLVVFFENLFNRDNGQIECDRICDFLGVDRRAGAVDQRINSSSQPVPEVDRGALVARLRPNYEFFLREFSGKLPASWLRDLDDLSTATSISLGE